MFDPEGEQAVIRECHEVLRSRTLILITHRPESLKLTDRILRLEKGELHASSLQVESIGDQPGCAKINRQECHTPAY